MFLITTRLRRRPAIKKQSQISCEGATTETGVFELSGAFDIELNSQVVATNLEPQALVDYLTNTGDFMVITPFEATIKNRWSGDPFKCYISYGWFVEESDLKLEVDWGDGSPIDKIYNYEDITHTYATTDQTYRINIWVISGRVREITVPDAEVVHAWGSGTIHAFVLKSLYLTQVPNYLPTYVTGTYSMFSECEIFNQDIGGWDVSRVTNMNSMFALAYQFDQDLSGWCVPNITTAPEGFSNQSALTSAHTPVWGTCPSGVTP